jgi:signal transduction histidine kinase
VTTSAQGNCVKVSVADTGCGISGNEMSKLFQRFTQIRKKPGGSGLGLAICKEIIDKHKGKIAAESEPGKGTTFHFILPVKERRL